MKLRGHWVLITLALVGMILLTVLVGLYPLLAMNQPSGARTVVVEGWIPARHMPAIKAEIDRLGYDRIYTTGTPRNVSYTLRMHDTISVVLRKPGSGHLLVSACGSDGSGFRLIADADTVLDQIVTPTCKDYRTHLVKAVQRLWLLPTHSGEIGPDREILFTLYMTLNDTNVHVLQRSITLERANGTHEEGLPTFADAAAQELYEAGVDQQKILALPTITVGDSRTWSNAQRLGEEVRRTGVKKVDVISLGIHARRSRDLYQKACGSAVEVGIISLADPDLERWSWWSTARGWVSMTKELVGLPASLMIDGPS